MTVILLPMLCFGGLRHPVLAAVFGIIWVIGRILYSFAYMKDPKYRGIGFVPCFLMLLCLLGCTLSTAFGMLNVW